MKRFIVLFLVLSSTADGDDGELYDHAVISVVRVCSVSSDGQQSFGYGVAVGPYRILTACELVQSKAAVWVFVPERERWGVVNTPSHYQDQGGTAIRCTVSAFDASKNLALLTAGKGPMIPAKLAARNPKPGASVFGVGGDQRVAFRHFAGSVNALINETGLDNDKGVHATVIETSASMSADDQGAPLFNGRGELVGIYFEADTRRPHAQKSIDLSEIKDFLKSSAR